MGLDPEVTPKSTVSFSGSDWSSDASYFYSGALYALNRVLGREASCCAASTALTMFEYDADVQGRHLSMATAWRPIS